jgi:hypothetical protein
MGTAVLRVKPRTWTRDKPLQITSRLDRRAERAAKPTEGVSGGPMLPTPRVNAIPAGKAPQRGADAVKVG